MFPLFDLVNKIEEVKVKVKTKEKHIIDIKDRFESIDIEDRKSTGVDVKKSLNEEPSKIHDSKLKDI